MKNTIIAIIVIIIIAALGYLLFKSSWSESNKTRSVPEQTVDTTPEEKPAEVMEEKDLTKTVIGESVEGNEITAYHYFHADAKDEIDTELLFIGGIHGGYSWNTVLVAYELMDYLEEDVDVIPDNVRVTVIPSLNPDGQEKVVGTAERFSEDDVPSLLAERIPGRFNANEVDLNRNFDCDWKEEGVWQSKEVSGGTEAFSEPESLAIRNYVNENDPDAVVVWYSSLGGVFTSNCHEGVLDETKEIASLFAKASGYKEYVDFDFYEITGDMVNWLAKEQIPAISVLLTNHEDTEWTKNQAGIDAIFEHYAK